METTILTPALSRTYNEAPSAPSVFARFFQWCTDQNGDRLLWIGIILAAHGCILTPVTAMAVFATGGSFALFMSAMVAMAMALVTNLAALPTKYTLPVFAFSILVDVAVVVAALSMA